MPQIQILPEIDPVAGLGRDLGIALGGGLGSLITGERERKRTEQMQQQNLLQRAQSYSALLGISPQEGFQLALLPEKQQQQLINKISESPAAQGLQQSGLESLMPQEVSGLLAGPAQAQPQLPAPAEPATLQEQVRNVQDVGQTIAETKSFDRDPSGLMNKIDDAVNLALTETRKEQGLIQPRTVSQLIRNTGMGKEEAKLAIKETHEFSQQLSKEARAAQEDEIRLRRMERLIESGNLRGPFAQNFLDNADKLKLVSGGLGALAGALLGPVGAAAGAGIGGTVGAGLASAIEAGVKAFSTPETQEFEKLSKDFIKNIKDSLGFSRITNLEVESFMKTIPTLAQTNEGKKRVIRNLRIVNSAKLARKKIADKIIRANGGRRPYNLKELVEQVADPILDALAEQFVSGTELTRPEPERKRINKLSDIAEASLFY